MHSATMTQITNHGHFKAVYGLAFSGYFLANGIEVQQCLGGVFIGTIATV